jgi:hypothetical protein
MACPANEDLRGESLESAAPRVGEETEKIFFSAFSEPAPDPDPGISAVNAH